MELVYPVGVAAVSLPVASAGADQSQADLSVVTLDGSGSSGATSYAWVLQEVAADGTRSTQTDLLSSSTAESPTFTPRGPGTVYIATLTATNDDGSSTDTSTVAILADATQVWMPLSLANANFNDPLTVISSIDTGTGAFTSNATACSFETSAAQPPTWDWDIPADCADDMGIEVWAEGLSFEIGAANGIAVALVDAVSTTTGTGLMAAMTSTVSAYRVAAGAYHSALGDVAQGAATWEVLYARFSLMLAGGVDTLGNALGRLLNNGSPRDMVSSSAAVSASANTPSFAGDTMKLVLAYQQDAASRSGVLPETIYYRRTPRRA